MENHRIRFDSGLFQWRISTYRSMASIGNLDIKPLNVIERELGHITIDNNLYNRYTGEIHILKDNLPASNKVNVIAKIIDEDLWKIKYLHESQIIKLVESNVD